ncbi:MAG: zinc ribbon domain-containing protein [Deltaproteobacteria bacterium]|nr:zinc ribbon domain-containing protein [Candidatus Zymogenaceae bacterium]
MPIYEYRCLTCEHIQEMLVVVGNREETPTCSKCGGTAFQKLMSASSSRVSPSSGDTTSSQTRCCGAESPRGDCIPGSCCSTKG